MTSTLFWVCMWIVSMVLTGFICWTLGKHEGVSHERWRWQTSAKVDRIPYSGLFDYPPDNSKGEGGDGT